MTVVLLKAKDKATGRLNAGISAATLSIPLQAGQGVLFPQPYTGTASSAGSRTVLNDTGDLGSLAVGDFIRNVTDGSWALVVTAGTNSITTTRLEGGTDNTWDNADTWRSGEFVITLATIDANGNDTAYEEALISNRSTDTLTVPTGGRGYNGTTAQSFLAADYVQLRVSAPYHEEYRNLLKEQKQALDTATTNITTLQTDVDNIESGVSFYIAAGGSANAFTATYSPVPAYAAGLRLTFKANHSITGTTTININSLGVKTIKKNDGATNLITGDIINGQIVEIEYDGTNFQMLSPVGTPTATHYKRVVYLGASDSSAVTSGSPTAFDTHSYTIGAGDLINGVAYEVEGVIDVTSGLDGMPVSIFLGGALIVQAVTNSLHDGTSGVAFKGNLWGTAAAGAAVAVRASMMSSGLGGYGGGGYGTANKATNGTLLLQVGANFGTSGSAVLKALTVTKISTSPF